MTRTATRTLLLTGLLALAASAQTAPKSKAGAPTDQFVTLRGHYIFGRGENRFEPCGGDKKYWVVGDLSLLQNLRDAHAKFAATPQGPVYAEIRGLLGPKPSFGAAASHDGVLQVQQIGVVRAKGNADCGAPRPATKTK